MLIGGKACHCGHKMGRRPIVRCPLLSAASHASTCDLVEQDVNLEDGDEVYNLR